MGERNKRYAVEGDRSEVQRLMEERRIEALKRIGSGSLEAKIWQEAKL